MGFANRVRPHYSLTSGPAATRCRNRGGSGRAWMAARKRGPPTTIHGLGGPFDIAQGRRRPPQGSADYTGGNAFLIVDEAARSA
jgi:hypothetical protein